MDEISLTSIAEHIKKIFISNNAIIQLDFQ